MGSLHHTPATFLKGIKRLNQFYAADAYDIIVILLFGLLIGLFSLAVPIGVNSLVSTVAFGTLMQPLVVLMLVVMIGLAFAAFLRLMQVYAVEIIQRRLFVRLSLNLSHLLPRFKLSIFKEQHGPELVNRFFEIITIQKITSTMLMEGVALLFQASLGLLLLSFYHPYLLVFGILLLLSLIIVLALGWGAIPSAVDESVMKYKVLAWLEELARFPILYKSLEGRVMASNMTDRLCNEYIHARYRHFSILFRQHSASMITLILGNGSLLALGGLLVIRQELSLGQLVAAELVVSTLLSAIAKMGKHLSDFYDLVASVDKLDYILEMPTEEMDGNVKLLTTEPLEVRFERVVFKVPSGKEAISNLSFTLSPGTKTSIYGRNGSGKSCIANLLYKLEIPTSGYITINGSDIRQIVNDSLRGEVALIRGIETVMGTIADNIRLSKTETSENEINSALHAVGLFERVMNFPQGINTKLQSAEASLSRSELLLLMLARALVTKPHLLILDETLDGIDPGSLDKVHEVILSESAPWTLLNLTHDKSISQRFPNKLVLNEGVLVT